MRENLQSAIFRPDEEKKVEEGRENEAGVVEDVVAYTILKQKIDPSQLKTVELPTIHPEEKEAYAKRVLVERTGMSTFHYFVKAGGRSGFLYDPYGLYQEGLDNLSGRVKGKAAWEWRRVSKAVFDAYCNYLKSHLKPWYLNANREFSNG